LEKREEGGGASFEEAISPVGKRGRKGRGGVFGKIEASSQKKKTCTVGRATKVE